MWDNDYQIVQLYILSFHIYLFDSPEEKQEMPFLKSFKLIIRRLTTILNFLNFHIYHLNIIGEITKCP